MILIAVGYSVVEGLFDMIQAFYILTLVSVNACATFNNSYKIVDPSISLQRISGIWSIIAVEAYVSTTWGVKASLLVLYARLSYVSQTISFADWQDISRSDGDCQRHGYISGPVIYYPYTRLFFRILSTI
jgi:hypothetical protein